MSMTVIGAREFAVSAAAISSSLPALAKCTHYCPRPVGGGEGAGALSGDRRPSSVCLSDVAYIGSNSKTKRPRKTKLCTGHMRLPHRLQGQKVKCQGHGVN